MVAYITNTCASCGNTYPAKTVRSTYCSTTCRVRAFRVRRRAAAVAAAR